MDLNLSYYLFLSKYIPLPLSGLKIIEKNKNHPLQSVESLSIKEIEAELESLNKLKIWVIICNDDFNIHFINPINVSKD